MSLTCKRCGQPTVYTSGICRWCQTPEEQRSKPSERECRHPRVRPDHDAYRCLSCGVRIYALTTHSRVA